MGPRVLLVHARSEEARAEELAGPLRDAGYDVTYEGTMLVGSSIVAEVSAALARGDPVVVCGTVVAIGTGWARKVVEAARSAGVRVFVVQMEEYADVAMLSFGERFARYWQNRDQAIGELVAALHVHYPAPGNAAAQPTSMVLCEQDLLTEYLNALIREIRHLRPGPIRVEKFKFPLELVLDEVYIELQAVPERPDVDRRVTLEELAEAQRAVDNFDWQDERDREQQRRLYAELDRSSRELDGPSGAPEDLGTIVDRHRQVVILGDPGSGKTTVLKHMALQAALANLAAPFPDTLGSPRVPLYLRVPQYAEYRAGNSHDATVGDYLLRYVAGLQVGAADEVTAVLRRLLDEGRCLILLDGLDEVIDDTDRVSVAGAIAQFAAAFQGRGTDADAPGNAFLVTSRIAGYRAFITMPASFSEYTIRPMRREQIERFLERWCQAVERQLKDGADTDEIDEVARREQELILAALTRSPGVRRLAENPLLLRILAMLHRSEGRLPQRRVELYREAADMLLYDWNVQRGLRRAAAIDKTFALKLLGPVAMEIHTRWPSGFMSLGKTEELLCGIRAPQRGDPPGHVSIETVREVQQFLKTVREHSGLFVERGNGLFGFMHQTFQEYFVARQLLSFRDKARGEIITRLHQPRWREPILLAVSAVNDPYYDDVEQYLTAILDAGSEHEAVLHRDLLFAADCIGDSVGVPELLRRDVARRLMTIYCDDRGAGRYAPLRRQIRDAIGRLNDSGDSWAVQAALADVLRNCDGDEAIALGLELVELVQADTQPVEDALQKVPHGHLLPGLRYALQRVQGRMLTETRQPTSNWDRYRNDAVLARALGALWLFGWRDLVEFGLGVSDEMLRSSDAGDAGIWLLITNLRLLAWRLEACDLGPHTDSASVTAELDTITGIMLAQAAEGSRADLGSMARFLAVIRNWYESEGDYLPRPNQVLGYLLDSISVEDRDDFYGEDQDRRRQTAAELLSGLHALRRGRRFTQGQRLRFGVAARRLAAFAEVGNLSAELFAFSSPRFSINAQRLDTAIGRLEELLGPHLQAQLEQWGRAVLRNARFLEAIAPTIVDAIRQVVPLAGDAATWRAAANTAGQAVIDAMTRELQAGGDVQRYGQAAFMLARLGDSGGAQALEAVRADLANGREDQHRPALNALRDPGVGYQLVATDEAVGQLRSRLGDLVRHQHGIARAGIEQMFAFGLTPELLAWCWDTVRQCDQRTARLVQQQLHALPAVDGTTPFLQQLDEGLGDNATRSLAESLLLRVRWVGTETYAQCLTWLSVGDPRTRQVAAVYLSQAGVLVDVPRETLRDAIREQLAAMVHRLPVSWAALRNDPAVVRLLRALWRHGWRDALALVWVDEPAESFLDGRYPGWRRNDTERVVRWFLAQARFGQALIPLVINAASRLTELEDARAAGSANPTALAHPDDIEQVKQYLLAELGSLANETPRGEELLRLPLRTDASVVVAALKGERYPRPVAYVLWDLMEQSTDDTWFWAAACLAAMPSQHPALRDALAAALDRDVNRRALALLLTCTGPELEGAMRQVLFSQLGRPDLGGHEILMYASVLLSSRDQGLLAADRLAIATRLRGTLPRVAPQLAAHEDGPSVATLGTTLLCDEPVARAVAGCLLLCEDLYARLLPPLVAAALSSDDRLRWVGEAWLERICRSLPTDGSTGAVGWLNRYVHDNFHGRMNVEGTGHEGSILRSATTAIRHDSTYWMAAWLEAIERGDDAERRAAKTAMEQISQASEEVVSWLCARLADGANTAVRVAVAASLRSLRLDSAEQRRNPAITNALVAATRDSEPMVRRHAADALQFTDHESAQVSVALLERAWDDQEALETRAFALVSLGRFLRRTGPQAYDVSADPLLRQMAALLADPCPLVSRAAAAGLSAVLQVKQDSMALLSAVLPDPPAVLAAALAGAANADSDWWEDADRLEPDHQALVAKLATWVDDRPPSDRDRLVEQMVTDLERTAVDMEVAVDDDLVGDPPWTQRRIISAVLAELSERLTHRSFAPSRPLPERVALFARVARDPDSLSTRKFCLRILGNLQEFTPDVATAFFEACRDVPTVYWESRTVIRKFKTFGRGCFQRLTAELFESGNDASVAAHAATLLGELGLSRSEELGHSGRREISSELIRFLRSPLAERASYELVDAENREYLAFRTVGPLYDPVYEALVRVVAGPDAPEADHATQSPAEPARQPGDDPSEQLDELIQRFEQQEELLFRTEQAAMRARGESTRHPIVRVVWREGRGENYYISFWWARQWVRDASYQEEGGYLQLTVKPQDRYLPPSGGLVVISQGADPTGWSIESGSDAETLLREPNTRLLYEAELSDSQFVVAVPLSMIDGITSASHPDRTEVVLRAAGLARLAPEDLVVGQGHVLGERNDLHVSFPLWEGAIERVSYLIEDNRLSIIVMPGEAGLKLRDADVIFTRGTPFPVVREADIKQLRRRKGQTDVRFTVSLPWPGHPPTEVSYLLAGNCLHIIVRPTDEHWHLDRDNVRFAVSPASDGQAS